MRLIVNFSVKDTHKTMTFAGSEALILKYYSVSLKEVGVCSIKRERERERGCDAM
jgi:hypothetical protein